MSKKKKHESTLPAGQQKLQAHFERSEDFRSIYTNFIQAGYSAFDVAVMIGETMGANEKGQVVVQFKARVTMSPLEAKLLALILMNTIVNYEKQYGPVRVPDDQIPDALKAVAAQNAQEKKATEGV